MVWIWSYWISHWLIVECKMVQQLEKIVWQSFIKFNIQLPYYPTIPLLGIYPKEMKTYANPKSCTWMVLDTVLVSFGCNNKLYNFGILKNTNLFSYNFWGMKSKISYTGLKSKCQQDWFLLEVLRGESILLPFSTSSCLLYSLACGPFLHSQITSVQSMPHHHIIFPSLTLITPASLLWGPLWCPTWII